MRVDELWSQLASRAVKQGGLDVETFVRRASSSGMSAGAVQDQLLDDLENDGPIFGKFFRGLGASAERTVVASHQQGSTLSDVDADAELLRLTGLTSMDDVIELADPAVADEIENAIAERHEVMWVAELRNTCHLCLPLHGTVATSAEWRSRGLHPDTIHEGLGANAAPCHCTLIPSGEAGDRKEEMAPLVRTKLESARGLKGRVKTARGVTQNDVDKAQAARTRAMESLAGRRTLRLLGRAAQFTDDTTEK